MKLIILNIWMISTIFSMMNHPLSLGFLLLIQTINISLITGLMMLNFWYSFMLFLIMIGGMLILFLYMTNVASNEKFKLSLNLFYIMIIIMMLSILINYQELLNFSFFNMNTMTNNLNKMINFKFSMSNYFNSNMYIYMLMIIYLFMTLIVVVKITNIKYGPLRSLK